MLDVEVVLVMEDGDNLAVAFGSGIEASLTLRRDGNGCEVDLLRHGGECIAELMVDEMEWNEMDSLGKGEFVYCPVSVQ